MKKFKDNLNIAILNSKKFKKDVNKLKNSIGTNIGVLFEELLKKDSIKD